MRDSRSSCEGLTEDEGGDGGTGGGGETVVKVHKDWGIKSPGSRAPVCQHTAQKTLQCSQPVNNSAVMFDLLKSAMFKQNMYRYFNFRM